MPVVDMVGYHSAKVHNAMPRHFEAAREAVEAAQRRDPIDGPLINLLADEGEGTFALALGNAEAKRAFEETITVLADENPDRAEVFEDIRQVTIEAVKEQREADGLGPYSDYPGGDA